MAGDYNVCNGDIGCIMNGRGLEYNGGDAEEGTRR
jgi:hypothetical protein